MAMLSPHKKGSSTLRLELLPLKIYVAFKDNTAPSNSHLCTFCNFSGGFLTSIPNSDVPGFLRSFLVMYKISYTLVDDMILYKENPKDPPKNY